MLLLRPYEETFAAKLGSKGRQCMMQQQYVAAQRTR